MSGARCCAGASKERKQNFLFETKWRLASEKTSNRIVTCAETGGDFSRCVAAGNGESEDTGDYNESRIIDYPDRVAVSRLGRTRGLGRGPWSCSRRRSRCWRGIGLRAVSAAGVQGVETGSAPIDS